MAFSFCKKTMAKADCEPIMRVDYYTASAATEDGGHYELVLTATDGEDTAVLDRYIKDSAESEEIKTSRPVPIKAVESVMSLIQKHHLHQWNGLPDGQSVDGGKTVLKYWNGHRHIRVSTDCMPPDGEAVLTDIRRLLEGYLTGCLDA